MTPIKKPVTPSHSTGEPRMTAAALRVCPAAFWPALAAGTGLLTARRLLADQPGTDADRFALLSDIHISGDRDREAHGIKPVEHFLRVRDEICRCRPRPAAVIVCGDCAFNEGLPSDYAVLRELVEPLCQAGLPPHLLMGNHDRRESLWQAFPQCKPCDRGCRRTSTWRCSNRRMQTGSS